MSTRASAQLLTGPVGAGKTTLAVEIGEILREAGQAHAVIELDWLAWCEPPAGSSETRRQLVLENLAATLRNYEAAEIRRFVLAGSIVSSSIWQRSDRRLTASPWRSFAFRLLQTF
jgi:adenylylsulfate kinase-like enzyme